MALVLIVINDTEQGPTLSVTSEPAMPANALQGPPTPAQSLAAFMLNAMSQEIRGNAPRVIVPQH